MQRRIANKTYVFTSKISKVDYAFYLKTSNESGQIRNSVTFTFTIKFLETFTFNESRVYIAVVHDERLTAV